MFSFLPEYERRTEAEERESDSKDERLLGTRRFSCEGRLLVAEDMMGAWLIELELGQLGRDGGTDGLASKGWRRRCLWGANRRRGGEESRGSKRDDRRGRVVSRIFRIDKVLLVVERGTAQRVVK